MEQERKISGSDRVKLTLTGRVCRDRMCLETNTGGWRAHRRQTQRGRDCSEGGKTFEKEERRVGAVEHTASKIELRKPPLKTEF